MKHYPVFHREIKKLVQEYSPCTILDLTFGRGGYTKISLDANPKNKVYAIDRDPEAIQFGKENFRNEKRLHLIHSTFESISQIPETPRLIFADLGISSPQIDDLKRGISIKSTELLDLRMNQEEGEPAWKILPTLDEEELANILYEFGEIKQSRSLSRRIHEAAMAQPITCDELVKICQKYPQSRPLHLATLAFQALRIYINQELTLLDQLLFELNRSEWKNIIMAFVTFHSLEDRVVKKRAQEFSWKKILFEKSVSEEEANENPRSRSAKLRVYEKS